MEYTKQTKIRTDVGRLFAWHERDGAVSRMTPPWVPLKLVHHSGGIQKGTRVRFILRIFGIPFAWEAEHVQYEKNRLFRDIQRKGPFKSWIHTHGFEAVSQNESLMTDHVDYELPYGLLGRLFSRLSVKDMERIFTYRHRVLTADLENLPDLYQPMTILVSGAGGTIGSALIPFLTTSGHRVIRLVRRPCEPGRDEIFWDPDKGILDLDDALQIDAVINLNGLDISRGRWTDRQKEKIIRSRTRPTELLIRTLAGRKRKPTVFLSASAIGFYGNRGSTVLTEKEDAGDRFISRVCYQWETACMKKDPFLADSSIRRVQMRIGIVLTPAGGALERMHLPFLAGLGTTVSHGRQYMSWISMEDILGAIHHLLFDPSIEGPVNLTAPNPVTNAQFTHALARVLNRPAVFRLPAFMVKLLWGQMGQETLLDSARVVPEKLIQSGYRFRFPRIDDAFAHCLGRW